MQAIAATIIGVLAMGIFIVLAFGMIIFNPHDGDDDDK